MSKKTKGSPIVSFRCHSVLRDLMILASEQESIDLGEWIRRQVIRGLGAAAKKIDPAMGIGLAGASSETKKTVASLGGKAPKPLRNKDLSTPKESAEK